MADLNSVFVVLGTLMALLASISGSSVDDSFQQQLLDRLGALETQGQDQSSILKTQAILLAKMESKLRDQAERLVSQEETIKEYKGRVKQLEITVDELKFPNYRQDSVTPGKQVNNDTDIMGETQSKSTSKKMPKQRRVLVGGEGPVAFHAVIKKSAEVMHIGVDQKIIFPYVQLNLGAGYHNLHGIFIAPQPGIYIFSTSITAYGHGHSEIWVHLMKNGNILANAFARADSTRLDQGSITVVTQLAVGDEMWVSLYGPADTSLWGDDFDSFMGCLVVPL